MLGVWGQHSCWGLVSLCEFNDQRSTLMWGGGGEREGEGGGLEAPPAANGQ